MTSYLMTAYPSTYALIGKHEIRDITLKTLPMCYCLILLAAAPILVAAELPLKLHPANPHYFVYQSKPTVLITSAEHYAAVLNLRFDYGRYLDELGRHGFNLTRVFSGTYREAAADPHGRTPLSPGLGPENFISPWALSDVEGGYDGRKYDLDRWNPAYFERLKSFCRRAHSRGVVVELVLFCRMYSDRSHWKVSPLHPDNNLQGAAWRGLGHQRFMTLDSKELVERQKAVTRKIVSELRDVPNVYIEIANEPASGPHDSPFAKEVHAWHEAIIDAVVTAESTLPAASRHLIAYNDHYETGRGIGPIPRAQSIGILNGHYLWKLYDLLADYGKGRALSVDETRWIAHPRLGQYGNTMSPLSGRVEAWDSLIGGASVYSNLNFAYQVGSEDGPGPQSNEFKGYLKKLKEFITSFDFVKMRPQPGVIAAGLAEGSISRVLAEPGKQYAIYIHNGTPARGMNRYEVDERPRALELALDLPAGTYRVDWVKPADLSVLATQQLARHSGGKVPLTRSPEYAGDVAIRIRRGN